MDDTVVPDVDQTVFVAPGSRAPGEGCFHQSRGCAGASAVPVSLGEAVSEHDPCRNCIGDARVDEISEVLAE